MVLKYKVFYSKRASSNRNDPSTNEALKWVPTSHTLIYGEKDAVLVDTPLTIENGKELLDWVISTGLNLTYIYTTHSHGDHFFGNGVILDTYPNAKAIATKEIVELMKIEVSPERVTGLWNKLFPGEIPNDLVVPDALDCDEFELEDEKLQIIRVGHTDTDDTTALYVQSIGLVVAGDAIYNNVHPMLMESPNKEARQLWLDALDIIEGLNPKLIVGGHKDPEQSDDPKCLQETRQYIQDFERVLGETDDVESFRKKMLEIYPNRLNPGSLSGSAAVAKGLFSLKDMIARLSSQEAKT
ncbi:Metallo-hydrolase/oxidoreductase [Cadophora sp. DSE1049]|nr:Metallo-hydrolase/oxidoreductase [Cadophora sp. DSE1049]